MKDWQATSKDAAQEATARPKYNLAKDLEEEIISLSKKYKIKKLLLFGSRARGSNYERSDIDLAVLGGDTLGFTFAVDEETQTLLMFDVVDLGRAKSRELLKEIERDGVLLYEEV